MQAPPESDGGYTPPEVDDEEVVQRSPARGELELPETPPPTAPSEFDIVTGANPAVCTGRRKAAAAIGGGGALAAVLVVVLIMASGSGDTSADTAGAALLVSGAPLQAHRQHAGKAEELHLEKTVDTASFAASSEDEQPASSADRHRLTIAVAALGSKLFAAGSAESDGSIVSKNFYRGLSNDHHLHCDASSSSNPLQTKTVTLPTSQLDAMAALPAEKDWSGEMNPAKDQEACGSCWAFSTNALVEYAIGAKGRGVVVNPAELLDESLHTQHMDAGSDDAHCRVGADAVDRQCGGSGGCEGLTALAGLNMLQCKDGGVHLWPDAKAEAELYEEYFHCLKDDNSCRYANDGECDDGSQGGTRYCKTGTDANDCETQSPFSRGGDGENHCNFQRALQKLTEPLATEPLEGFEIVELDAFVDEAGGSCDMNRDSSQCFPNVQGMIEALQHGPIAVGVDASPLEHYRPGWSATKSRTPYVVSANAAKCETMCGRDESCQQECSAVASKAAAAQTAPTVDHAVTIVGYGTDELGGPYWKIRNSWGEAFGESGHVKVERATGAIPCGVDTRLQDGSGCKVDGSDAALSADCSARYCGAMGVISPGMVQLRRRDA